MKSFLKFSQAIILLLSLISCNTANYNNLTEASKEIATYCGTQNVLVSNSTGFFTNDETNAYTITVNNVNIPFDYTIRRVASHCAQLLYNNLSNEQRKDKDVIRVTINLKGRSETSDFKMAKLKDAETYIKRGHVILGYIKKGDYKSLHDSLDPKYFTEDGYDSFQRLILEKNKNVFAKIDTIVDDGFSFDIINGKPFVQVYSHTPIDTMTIRYRFLFDLRKSSFAALEIK